MQKSMWLTAALLLLLFISGCGGSNSTSTIASTTTPITSPEVAKQKFYVVPLKSSSYTAFQTYSGSTSHDWYTSLSSPPDSGTRQGTWSVSSADGTLTFNTASGTPVYKFTRMQVEPSTTTLGADKTGLDYWLVYDDVAKKNCRIYFDQTKADTYIATAAVQNGLMGGAIQGTPLGAFANISASKIFSNVSTVTGTGKSGFSNYTSTLNTPAQFGRPVGITTTDGKTFFVVDNVDNDIRMLRVENGVMKVRTLQTKSGTTTTSITLNLPCDITTDGTHLYVTDTNNYMIRKLTPDDLSHPEGTWTMTTLAGTGASGAIDGTGGASGSARFGAPVGITTDGTNLYVTDNQAVRKIVITTGDVTTLAGSLGAAGSDNGTGTSARFNLPTRLTTDGTNLYVTDSNNYTIRKIVIATGVVTTVAGVAGTHGVTDTNSAKGTVGLFSGPEGITTDGTYLYVTDWGRVTYGNPTTGQTVRRVEIASGAVLTIAGTSRSVIGTDLSKGRSALDAYFDCPAGITTDGTSLYVADALHYAIRRIK